MGDSTVFCERELIHASYIFESRCSSTFGEHQLKTDAVYSK